MKRQVFWLTIFAIAMALLEAAVVVYLRELYYPGNIRAIFPLRLFNALDVKVELAREAATIVMMLSVAFLAVKKDATRIFAAFVYQFGIWDIFYYVWLKVFIGWPLHWGEWDILFLIPWAWFGPWICPALIALLFVIWGGVALTTSRPVFFDTRSLAIFILGAGAGLIAFLQPAFTFVRQYGVEQIEIFQPGHFWWPLYIVSLILMTIGLFQTLRKQR